MGATAEGDVRVRITGDIELLGLANCRGSRLAEPIMSMTTAPAGIICPLKSTGSRVRRSRRGRLRRGRRNQPESLGSDGRLWAIVPTRRRE